MKYLVTGGAGFIGSHLVDSLSQAGHQVRVLDDLSSGSLNIAQRDIYRRNIQAHLPRCVEFILGDITEAAIVKQAMRDIDGCFHLAAVASVERGTLDWIGSHRTNITGTITIFDEARHCDPVVPVVFASSAAVYGDSTDVPFHETARLNPMSAYGADKLGCELHGGVAARIHGVPNCGLRFFNVYGPRQDPKSPYSGVITIFGDRLKEKQPITINGDGYTCRDFIYVGDVVIALEAAMEFLRHSPLRKWPLGDNVFNVCTGVETNILDLADTMGRIFGPPKIKFGPARPGDPFVSVGDPTRAHDILGFRATIDIETGLKKTFS